MAGKPLISMRVDYSLYQLLHEMVKTGRAQTVSDAMRQIIHIGVQNLPVNEEKLKEMRKETEKEAIYKSYETKIKNMMRGMHIVENFIGLIEQESGPRSDVKKVDELAKVLLDRMEQFGCIEEKKRAEEWYEHTKKYRG
jgi:hypothetical protein